MKPIVIRTAGLGALLFTTALVLTPLPKQFCGEAAIYRVDFRLRACERNDEAAEKFYCHGLVGGIGEYFLWRDLTAAECSVKPGYHVPAAYRFFRWLAT
ncbi:hypothetical protein BH11PSE11_BH11PSE11_34460 [soil metagenome]